MLKTLTKTVLLACIPWTVFAQDILHATEPNHLGLANTGLSLESPFSLGHNPALLSQSSNLELATSISNRYGIKNLNYFILEAHTRHKTKGLGLRLEQLHTKHYSRTVSTVGIGVPINSKLQLGVSITNIITKITESSTSLQLFYQAGATFSPKDKLTVSAAWKSDYSEQHQLSLGSAFSVSEAFTMIIEHLNNTNTTSWKIASMYGFNKTITLLSGFDLQNRTFHFGINLQTKSLTFLFGCGIGQPLGMDSATGITYSND
ncbi:MAG: hypothetical protein ACI8ZO_001253 [Flavobacteriales bacterium]|jgi:hypothetical protein